MSKKLFFALILILLIYPQARASQEVPSERIVEQKLPTPGAISGGEKGEWSFNSFYERSDVVQGSRNGRWDEVTNRLGYKYNNINWYGSVSKLQRFDDKDYTSNLGTFFEFKNYFIHEEVGVGWDVDFIYKIQNILEVGHKLYKNLYWSLGYNYRAYRVNDTHLIYPGLIYYFGDNYIGLDYGVTLIEGRGLSQYGVFKSDFALTKSLHWSFGTAIGQRLYDIYEYDPSKEYGYILFTGFNYNICKWADLRAGYSYGSENPKFIKRSFNFNLSLKF